MRQNEAPTAILTPEPAPGELDDQCDISRPTLTPCPPGAAGAKSSSPVTNAPLRPPGAHAPIPYPYLATPDLDDPHPGNLIAGGHQRFSPGCSGGRPARSRSTQEGPGRPPLQPGESRNDGTPVPATSEAPCDKMRRPWQILTGGQPPRRPASPQRANCPHRLTDSSVREHPVRCEKSENYGNPPWRCPRMSQNVALIAVRIALSDAPAFTLAPRAFARDPPRPVCPFPGAGRSCPRPGRAPRQCGFPGSWGTRPPRDRLPWVRECSRASMR
jgi:hypothetical protein